MASKPSKKPSKKPSTERLFLEWEGMDLKWMEEAFNNTVTRLRAKKPEDRMPGVEQLSAMLDICHLSVEDLEGCDENIQSWKKSGKHVADEVMKVMQKSSKKRKAMSHVRIWILLPVAKIENGKNWDCVWFFYLYYISC